MIIAVVRSDAGYFYVLKPFIGFFLLHIGNIFWCNNCFPCRDHTNVIGRSFSKSTLTLSRLDYKIPDLEIVCIKPFVK